MLFSNISVLDENFEVKTGQYVAVKDEHIVYIGSEKPQENYGDVYDGKGKLLMSGLYNCHTHSPMTLLRGYGENMVLFGWLDLVQPVESTLTQEEMYTGTTLAIAEMMRYGTVSCTDMYLKIDTEAEAFLDAGFKCNLSWGVSSGAEGEAIDTYRSVRGIEENRKRFQNQGNGLIIPDASLHAEYTSNSEVAKYMADYAKEHNLRMHVHISECKREHEECKARHGGMTPTQYFDSLGVFDQPTTAAHCVWAEPQDVEIFKKRGVTVASCPFSNMKLASGFCNISNLVKQGINVNIATDGAASNNSLNQFAELKVAATMAKAVAQDPTVITPWQALAMVTINGAKAQGREDCGAIKVGNRADCIVINMDQPYFMPIYDVPTALVYASSGQDVCLTMIDGKVVYKDGEYMTIDIEKVKADAKKMLSR